MKMTRSCHYCGRKLQSLTAMVADSLPAEVAALPMMCDCSGSVAADKAATEDQERRRRDKEEGARFAASGMPEGFRSRVFGPGCLPRAEMRAAYGEAWRWVQAVIRGARCRPMLYVAGDLGTGKTWLAACCANALVHAGRWVTWRRYGDLLRDIKDTYSDRSTMAERALLEWFGRRARFLVIDDLGKDKPSEWAVSRLYDIIDSRYAAGRSTIFTTNYGGDALIDRLTPRDGRGNVLDEVTPRAIVDRLREVSLAVRLEGGSLRCR